MSSKFFTNQNNRNTLSEKINRNLKDDTNVSHLDFLIGYIRLSGLKSIIENMEDFHSRILVGLKSDTEIYQAINLQEEFSKTQTNDPENDFYFMEKIQKLIKDGKLTIKITKERNVHAKMYIFRNNPKNDEEYRGSVIIGSSNLTYNGLEKNYELNTEIQDRHYIKDGADLFNALWEDSQELTNEDIERYINPFIKKPKTIIQKNSDIFHKSLIEYFDYIINNNLSIKSSNINLFEYQKDAINSAIMKLNRYNGAILGDVVGLGKTIIAIGVLQIFKKQSLIIAPPAIHNQWIETLKSFDITNYEIVTYAKLKYKEDFEIVVIDESHNLRNNNSRYKEIQELCKMPFRKKVLLLSATLQNNSPADIANQIYLFQDKNSSNLPDIVSLEDFFNPLIREFKNLKTKEVKKTNEEIQEVLKDISEKMKKKVLIHLLVRRTRDDIQSHKMYQKDIDAFPEIGKLKSLSYNLGEMSADFTYTIGCLSDDKQNTKKLNYERFKFLNTLNETGKNKYREQNPHMSDNIFDYNNLSTLMRYSVIKRFDSSLGAFKITLKNQISRLSQFIIDLKKDKLYAGDKSDKVLDRETSNKEYFYDGDKIYYIKQSKHKEPQTIYLKGMIFKKTDFTKPEQYIKRLENDLDILNDLQDIWSKHTKDPKLDKFIDILKNKEHKKLVIFTEFSDTLDYIKANYPKELVSKTLFITSKNRKDLENKIEENFDENYKGDKQDNYDIIITTDTLAEGVNLHRSDSIINYDLPWNSTKLMQRMGRINRIGSKFTKLNVMNFKPTDESNQAIGLLEKSFIKLQSFHYTLGEDSKILFNDEIVESFGIQKDTDKELEYLQIIRDFKENNPKEFEILKAKKEISVKIQAKEIKELSFFSFANISYFYEKENGNYKNIDFLDYIKLLEDYKVSENVKSDIDTTIDYHITSINTKEATKNDLKNKLTKNDKDAIRLLKKWYQDDKIIENDLFKNIKILITSKLTDSFSLKILKLENKNKDDVINGLKNLQNTSNKQVDFLDKKNVKTKIFISLEDKE